MKTARLELEKSELLALMWAIETASYADCPTSDDQELHDECYAVHQRLQDAWRELIS